MNLVCTAKPSFNRRALATQAVQAAIATRAKAKLDQHRPIRIYELCDAGNHGALQQPKHGGRSAAQTTGE
jgi:hypothetical protein